VASSGHDSEGYPLREEQLLLDDYSTETENYPPLSSCRATADPKLERKVVIQYNTIGLLKKKVRPRVPRMNNNTKLL